MITQPRPTREVVPRRTREIVPRHLALTAFEMGLAAARPSRGRGRRSFSAAPKPAYGRPPPPLTPHPDPVQVGADQDPAAHRRRVHRIVVAAQPHVMMPRQPQRVLPADLQVTRPMRNTCQANTTARSGVGSKDGQVLFRAPSAGPISFGSRPCRRHQSQTTRRENGGSRLTISFRLPLTQQRAGATERRPECGDGPSNTGNVGISPKQAGPSTTILM
jgi:hypothetical protein